MRKRSAVLRTSAHCRTLAREQVKIWTNYDRILGEDLNRVHLCDRPRRGEGLTAPGGRRTPTHCFGGQLPKRTTLPPEKEPPCASAYVAPEWSWTGTVLLCSAGTWKQTCRNGCSLVHFQALSEVSGQHLRTYGEALRHIPTRPVHMTEPYRGAASGGAVECCAARYALQSVGVAPAG